MKTNHTIKKGDIFYMSWGYDQTNADFFQVIKLVGKTMVEIRSICSKSVNDETTYSDVVPVKDSFQDNDIWSNGKPMKKKVKDGYNGSPAIKIANYANAYLWDGKPCHETNPMFGH